MTKAGSAGASVPKPEILSGGTSDWRALTADDPSDESAVERTSVAQTRFRETLSQLVNAEHLVVLAGSGTSIGLSSSDGNHKAPSMKDLWDQVKALPAFTAAEERLNSDLVSAGNLEHVLSDAQARNNLNPVPGDSLDLFIRAAEAHVLESCSFIDPQSSLPLHETFLRKVARRSTRLQRAQIFTTNYDRAFEVAARRGRFAVIDGFGYGGDEFDGASFDLDYVRRRPSEPLNLEPNVFHLLKLHGSVDWDAQGDVIRKLPHSQTPDSPVLIYPSAAKYQLSYKEPYLEFMSRFQIALRQQDVGLIVVGFGFADDHLTAPIRAALRGNTGLRAVFVAPSARGASDDSTFGEIARLIGLGDRRLSLLAGTFEDLTRLLPDVPESEERDIHLDRFAKRGGTSPS